MTTDQSNATTKKILPDLKTISTIESIPVISLVVTKAHDGYEKVKNSNAIMRWYLSTTEATMSTVARITLPIVERPLKAVDGLTSKGINMLMTKVPAVNTPPEEIVSNTKSFVSEKATAVGNFSLNTTNAILNNRVGLALLGTVDKVTNAADGTFGKYLPKPVDESETQKYLPEDNNEFAKSLNKITGVLATAGRRFMRKRRSTTNINMFKKMSKTNCDQLKGNIEKIRRKTTEESNDVVLVRSLATDVTRLANVADFVVDGLVEDQINNLKAARENVQNVASILEQTPSIKELSDEAVEDLKTKIDLIRNTLMEVFTAAGVNWFKIPEEKIVSAKEELVPEKKPSEQS